MTVVGPLRYLRVVLVLAGLACLALYPLMLFWPTGWAWHVGHSAYPMMLVGIYATLGVFLIVAARDPLAHLSLIWFTVWSSVIHGGIMAVQAVSQTDQMGHLAGDVPALFIVAIALAVLTRRSRGTDAPHRSKIDTFNSARKECDMIGVVVTFRCAEIFDERSIRKIAESARARFAGMPALRSKAFTFNSGKREATNFYVWDTEDAAKAFFTEDLLERVAGLYGVRPHVEFVQIAALVENNRA